MRYKLIGIAAMLAVTHLAYGASQRSSRYPTVTFLDYGPTPQTLQGYISEAPVILRIKIVKSDAMSTKAMANTMMVMHKHEAEVLQVLKDDGSIGIRRLIFLSQPGGTLDVAGQTIVTDYGMRLLEAGDDVVVFLAYWPAIQSYTLAYGPASVLYVRNGRVEIPKVVKDVSYLAGRRTVTIQELLRAARDQAIRGK